MKRLRLIIFALFSILLIWTPFANKSLSVKPSKKVALLKSKATLKIFSWQYLWEHKGAEETLKELKVDFEIVSDDDLKKSDIAKYSLIILPNIRCISQAACMNLKNYAHGGGKIFALYQSSYRNERNECVTEVNNFQLADVYGADFYRWTNVPPKCEFLLFTPQISGAGFDKNLSNFGKLQLGRNTAMLVKVDEGTKILAVFLNTDGNTPSETGQYSSGIIENKEGSCIYSSENLFAPENSKSPEVRKVICYLLERLSGGIIHTDPEKLNTFEFNYYSPYKPKLTPPHEGEIIKAGLGTFDSISISSDYDLQITNNGFSKNYPKGKVLYIEVISTLLKKPYLAVYSEDKKILGRFPEQFEIKNTGKKELINVLKINPNGTYKIKSYRGKIRAVASGDKVKLINILPLEEYTAGVLPNEMPQYFPEQALKTMGIINRTFVLANLGRHKNEGFDVCSTVHCQVYGGLLSEEETTTAAIIKTKGRAVFYGDSFADTTFHSCCGGLTEDVEKVWQYYKPTPYLVSASESTEGVKFIFNSFKEFKDFIDNPPQIYCQHAGRFRWKEVYSKESLERLFKESLPEYFKDYVDFGSLLDLKAVERSPHGRVEVLEIVGTDATYKVYKDSIRWLFCKGKLGLGGLQSTLFYIEKASSGNYIFIGGGWGHGAGMCQEGTYGMAESGFSYEEIIKHYYPGCLVKQIQIE